MRFKVALLISVLFFNAVGTDLHASEFKPVALKGIKDAIVSELRNADNELGEAVKQLSGLPLNGDGAHAILERLCARLLYSFDCATVDATGKLLAVEPNRTMEGRDISKHEYFAALVKTQKPQFSRVLQTVGGFSVVSLQRPIFNKDGTLKGAAGIMMNAGLMLTPIIKERLSGVPASLSVMQTDGRLVFDNDPDQVGRSSFSDPLYERFVDLQKLLKEIIAKPSGSGGYSFYKENADVVAKKEAFWDSLAAHGTEWRLVLIHTEAETPARALGDQDGKLVAEAKAALGRLAVNRGLQEALKVQDENAAAVFFKAFREKYPFVYSVQWVDPQGINRFGFPRENSLNSYDFNTSKLSRDRIFLKVLNSRGKAEFKQPLLEGDIAWFFVQPVFNGEEYMGYIYFMIRL